MNKLLTLFAAVAVLMMTACAADDLVTADSGGDTVEVTLTAKLPSDLATRVYSDGLTATYLSYAVYKAGMDELELVESVERENLFVNHEATITLTLVKNRSYDIVFWADAGRQCPYTLDLAAGTVTMDYATSNTITANNEARDAFYAVASLDLSTSTNTTQEVTLRRPFAQLNWGTDDLSAPIITSNYSLASSEFSVTISAGNLATVFHLTDATASTSEDEMTTEAVTFTATGIPAASDGTFPVGGYEYLSMNYVLPVIAADETAEDGDDDGDGDDNGDDDGEDDEDDDSLGAAWLIDTPVVLATTLKGNSEATVTTSALNVPLRSNYRTNIYGSLLTSPHTYNISIDENYNGEGNYTIIDNELYCIIDNELYYTTTDPATLLTLLQKGVNVALIGDITISGLAYVGNGTKFNLNGYTLTTDKPFMLQSVTVEITNGSITYSAPLSSSKLLFCYNSTLTMDNVTLDCKGFDPVYYPVCGIYYSGNNVSTIKNCTISLTADCNDAYGIENEAGYNSNAITLENTTIVVTNTSSTYGLYTYGLGTITAKGCTISVTSTSESDYSYGVYNRTYDSTRYPTTYLQGNTSIKATNSTTADNYYDIYHFTDNTDTYGPITTYTSSCTFSDGTATPKAAQRNEDRGSISLVTE